MALTSKDPASKFLKQTKLSDLENARSYANQQKPGVTSLEFFKPAITMPGQKTHSRDIQTQANNTRDFIHENKKNMTRVPSGFKNEYVKKSMKQPGIDSDKSSRFGDTMEPKPYAQVNVDSRQSSKRAILRKADLTITDLYPQARLPAVKQSTDSLRPLKREQSAESHLQLMKRDMSTGQLK